MVETQTGSFPSPEDIALMTMAAEGAEATGLDNLLDEMAGRLVRFVGETQVAQVAQVARSRLGRNA